MNEQPLISVIVPIYNVEKYLRKCVDSIINQTYRNLQIILVNDGSTDGCLNICKEYVSLDNRVNIIDKKNGGLSSARNAGMKVAKGSFFAFIDSDDWILETAFEKMIEKQKIHDADLVVCGKMNYIEKTNKYVHGNLFEQDIHCNKEDAIKLLLLKSVSAWNKLYKRSIFEDISYPEGRIGEDSHIILRILNKCNNVEIIAEELYIYNVRANSIMSSPFKDKDIHMLEDNVNHYIEINKNYKGIIDVGEYNIFLISVILLNKISKLDWKNVIKKSKYINECRMELKKIKKNLYNNQYVYLKLRIAVLLIYYVPYLYILERKMYELRK